MKDDRVYLQHIRDCLELITIYTEGGRSYFMTDRKTQDAVIRNLEILGEAVKHLSDTAQRSRPEVPWRRLAGMRDVLIHQYFGVKLDIVWDVIEKEVPKLLDVVDQMLQNLGTSDQS